MSVTFRFLENCYNSEISSKSIWLKGKIEFVENSGKSILPRAPLDSSPQASTFPSVPHLRRQNLHSITSKARKWDGKTKCIQSHPQSQSSAASNKTKSTFSHFQIIKSFNKQWTILKKFCLRLFLWLGFIGFRRYLWLLMQTSIVPPPYNALSPFSISYLRILTVKLARLTPPQPLIL